jgi:PhnB protein
VAVQLTLIGEARVGGGCRDRRSRFEQAARTAKAVGDLERVRGQAGLLAEQAYEAELADTGDGGQLIEADVALGEVREVFAGQAQRPVVRGSGPGSSRPDRQRAVDQRAQPLRQSPVALQAGGGRFERLVQSHEVVRQFRIREDGLGKGQVGRDHELLVASEGGQVGCRDEDQAGRPRAAVDCRPGVSLRGIPGDELPRSHKPALASPARSHRLTGDDAEDVFAARLDRVASGPSGHQQHTILACGAPDANLVGRHQADAKWVIPGRKIIQDRAGRSAYGAAMLITPHLVVRGAACAAVFYREAFAAEEESRIPTPDGRLMSVVLRVGEARLHLADEFPEIGVLAPPSIGGTPVVLALEVADAEAVFAQAVAAGAAVRRPLQDMFWGERHGQLEDPFGHHWNVSQHVREVAHDEVVAAAAQLFADGRIE